MKRGVGAEVSTFTKGEEEGLFHDVTTALPDQDRARPGPEQRSLPVNPPESQSGEPRAGDPPSSSRILEQAVAPSEHTGAFP